MLSHLRQPRKPELQRYTALGIVPYQPLVTERANQDRLSGGWECGERASQMGLAPFQAAEHSNGTVRSTVRVHTVQYSTVESRVQTK